MDDIGESRRHLVEGEDVLNCDPVIECSVAPEPTADSVRIDASLQRRNSYLFRDALFKADFFTPDSPATLRFLDLIFAEDFLLALTFLFFAVDDRAVADLLRLDLRLLLFPAVAFLALDLLVVVLAPLVLERDDRRLLVRLVVLRFAGVAEALFLLRPRAREGDAMEAPSLTPLVDTEFM
ncbi:hypothetical protein HPB47_009206 [Ixodes persulcatus]|uniref:Uncharacterized protein n=1 Tax=Ixodes persulcatus TaxID=34615 RepID=A0AC60P2K2_IXOPE|nr:hypothetical protein HPB47_009206 [Ixodes persulcatus]